MSTVRGGTGTSKGLGINYTIDVKFNKALTKKQTEEAINQALTEAINLDVLATAKRISPADTGLLQNSLASKVEGHEAIVFSEVEYSKYVEFMAERLGEGNINLTKSGSRIPFMRPALYENSEKIVARFKRAFDRML